MLLFFSFVHWVNKLTLNDAICAFTVALANLAAFALNFIGVKSFRASWSNDCNTNRIQQKITYD